LKLFDFYSYFFLNVKTFHPLFQKLQETDGRLKLQTCSACQDLHTCNFEVNLITHLGVIALFNHPRNIPAKFGSNRPSGFGEEA
jgi:recombinational DNA repair protein (RecF pathway)